MEDLKTHKHKWDEGSGYRYCKGCDRYQRRTFKSYDDMRPFWEDMPGSIENNINYKKEAIENHTSF